MMTNIEWLQSWYISNCNGDWEHLFGVKINTLDNPGWKVIIDTSASNTVIHDIKHKLIEHTENNWYAFGVENGLFIGACGPSNLDFLIGIFRDLAEKSKR